MKQIKKELQIAGRTLTVDIGKMAKQADGAALVQYGDSMVLVAAVSGPPRPGIDFFPLQVDYREKTYSAGKIPGGFFKREGRPTTKEILTMRLIDRPIRPLFPDGYKDDLQIYCNVLSFDQANDPDVPSLIGASMALSVSAIPFQGPVGAVRIGRIDGEFVINPEAGQIEKSEMDIVAAGTKGSLSMVEGEAREVPESVLIDALTKAQEIIDQICDFQMEIVAELGIGEKTFEEPEKDTDLLGEIQKRAADRVVEAIRTPGKFPRRDAIKAIREEMLEAFVDQNLDSEARRDREKAVRAAFDEVTHNAHRKVILSGTRADGRGYTDVRPISVDTSLLPRVHGAALFTRGETQALVAMTLGSMADEQRIDGLLEEQERKKFLLHYNFPSFSVGETKPIRGPGRREIGHGNLAERSVAPVLPDWEAFPYTIRLVSDILESNGSSSMATICGSSLALMDGGVPLKSAVAGIAMGLLEQDGQTCILTDILGDEDHHGDMDFKVAGTEKGVTGLQMDIKISGISRELLEKALEQARQGRLHILAEMAKALPAPRPQTSDYAPSIAMVMIDPEKIGKIIGPGGKTINKMQTEYEVNIEVDDDGRVVIMGVKKEGLARAQAHVEGLTAEAVIGQIYKGKVTGIKDFGAFVEILPGTEGLCHISELGPGFIEKVTDVVKEGDEIDVKVLNIDDSGKVKLTRRGTPGCEDMGPPQRRDSGGGDRRRRSGGGRRSDRGGDRGGDRKGGHRDRGPRRDHGDNRRRDGDSQGGSRGEDSRDSKPDDNRGNKRDDDDRGNRTDDDNVGNR